MEYNREAEHRQHRHQAFMVVHALIGSSESQFSSQCKSFHWLSPHLSCSAGHTHTHTHTHTLYMLAQLHTPRQSVKVSVFLPEVSKAAASLTHLVRSCPVQPRSSSPSSGPAGSQRCSREHGGRREEGGREGLRLPRTHTHTHTQRLRVNCGAQAR